MSRHRHHDKGKASGGKVTGGKATEKDPTRQEQTAFPHARDQGNDGGAASKPAAAQAGGESDSAVTRTAPLAPAPLASGLYVVATPIGNAADITLRALEVLRAVDAVACEDSRVTAKLLARHGIAASLTPYHEHNAARVRPQILARLADGARIALVSDAGTPLVSDPGYKLVRDCIEAGIPVVPLPGPSAPLAALILSGLPSDRFLFAGFLPAKSAARRRALGELAAVPATLLFFESAPRLAESLADMAAVLGDRPAAVAREITKLFEECRRGRLAALADHYREAGPPKGEIVVVCGGATGEAEAQIGPPLDEQLTAALARLSLKDAVAAVAAATGLPRKQVYARALALTADQAP
jgi:16S rRNA (cytidine1402-2'-O)-methyltransferase